MTNTITLELDEYFGLSLVAGLVVGFQCIMFGFMFPGRVRGKVFTPQFLEQFKDAHQQAFGNTDVTASFGYPDMGNGYYAQKLDYKDWIYFNKAQRVHYNYLEIIAPVMAFIFIGGIRYGLISAIFGFIFFVGRLFSIAYMSDKGARHPLRSVSALLCDISFLANFVIALIASI
jgi:hypothetical protein